MGCGKGRIACLLAGYLLGVSTLCAQLRFDETELAVEVPLGAAEVTREFPFRNAGETPVRILNVSSDCGCTAATPAQRDYAPGETGIIPVTFTVGNRTGERIQRVFLQTDHPEESRQTLILRVSIPSEVTIEPRVLQWRAGEPLEAQTITVTVHPESALELTGVSTSEENVRLSWEEITGESEKSRRYRITVTPAPADTVQRFRLDFTWEPADAPSADRGWSAFGLVRR